MNRERLSGGTCGRSHQELRLEHAVLEVFTSPGFPGEGVRLGEWAAYGRYSKAPSCVSSQRSKDPEKVHRPTAEYPHPGGFGN